jgi:hypothetical protein
MAAIARATVSRMLVQRRVSVQISQELSMAAQFRVMARHLLPYCTQGAGCGCGCAFGPEPGGGSGVKS